MKRKILLLINRIGEWLLMLGNKGELGGYDWEDPSIDPDAAIRQIQELLDEKL